MATGDSHKHQVSPILYLIVVVFNLSSFIDINGSWAEMPLFVQRLPEYWALPSYFTLVLNVAAIAPCIYYALQRLKPTPRLEVPSAYAIIISGFTSCILLTFCWSMTASIGGSEHSVGLLSLSFILALTDGTSSVVFLSFMSIFPSEYLSAFFVGDGMCGVLPSIVATIQGAGEYTCVNVSIIDNVTNSSTEEQGSHLEQVLKQPLFPVSVFYGFLAFILAMSCGAFSLLNFHPWCQKFYVNQENKEEDSTPESFPLQPQGGYEFKEGVDSNERVNVLNNNNDVVVKEWSQDERKLRRHDIISLFFQNAVVFGMRYGVLYPLQSYSLLPYGTLAFSLGNRVTTVAQPLGSFLELFLPVRSTRAVTIATSLGSVASTYILIIATYSPNPPLKEPEYRTLGICLVVTAWVVMSLSWGYSAVGIAKLLNILGKQYLMSAGLLNNIGTAMGSIVSFILINVFGLFTSSPPCEI